MLPKEIEGIIYDYLNNHCSSCGFEISSNKFFYVICPHNHNIKSCCEDENNILTHKKIIV